MKEKTTTTRKPHRQSNSAIKSEKSSKPRERANKKSIFVYVKT